MRITGSCHCGNIAFDAEGEFDTAMECNCSFCRRKGVLLAFVPRSQFQLATSQEKLSSYQFNKHVITHYFCAYCGIAPFSEATMPNGTEMAAINLRCVPEIDIATLTVTQYDGASR
ncbi:Glutathione-dependent formaldehyde-activating GFA [Neorhizobium galegae bv. officinalis bv. officinalis str. HAMBI 1141]|uniref:Glutathione-dependent formaldehyde-activating GFA n=1 Tax=Neorhizobium galegae bv. officinalis bv. officinalis str. HAMBI 1141 TaxID=1028801 RepID=A0A068T8K1_NEOGA|nr:GFA family protein [Neorhizobium galegae]CDN54788.1 Glutathione-dependent formaldehyde-activating GFA [Neorhizobium galegae bv. officinalis bv. officinalis str. HAMBI 1141]